jgi:glutamate-1-semialdehyde 2,1-aminomutase
MIEMDSKFKSFRKFEELFPGGVNSPVRRYADSPRIIESASGSRLTDINGNTILDYCLGFGPFILGYGNEYVKEALAKQIEKGVGFGAPNLNEAELAGIIRSSVPSIRMMRFTNSGTEATMHAIRLARGYTGKKLIVKLAGSYHGAHDYSLIRAGSGSTTFGNPSSPGIPDEVSRTVLIGEYNNLDSVRKIFRDNRNEIAALITEPALGNIGFIRPENDFIKGVREITEEYDSLLILDEVITGYRFRFGAYQDILGVKSDITTMGKIIGGGLPIGLLGGSEDILSKLAPLGSVYEAGTFSGNPLSMASGIATLSVLKKMNYSSIEKLTESLVAGIDEILESSKIQHEMSYLVSAFQFFLTSGHVKDYESALKCDQNLYMKIFNGLLQKGIYLAPSQFETNFLSFAHSRSDIDLTISTFEEVVKSAKN